MNRSFFMIALATVSISVAGCQETDSVERSPRIRILTNGIKVVCFRFPQSTNVSIFTFLPMGLTSDASEQAQWSHLIEHLIIRSTMPAGSREANAETLPDHMRLDYYGNVSNWKEGLSHHRRWIEGIPFTQENLESEKPKVISECEFTARNLTTHKFAVAAWAQGYRHHRKHVALKGDVTRARLTDVQELRDQRLAVSNRTTVCIVGGLTADEVFFEVEKELGTIILSATEAKQVEPISTNELNLTWDLDARHLLLTWPVPDFRQADHAALMVAAQWLNMQFYSDAKLKRLAAMTLAGADLRTPEGTFFYLSASLKPQTSFEELRHHLLTYTERLLSGADSVNEAGMIGRQLGRSLVELPDQRVREAQTSRLSAAMIEGNAGLQLGMQVHRYGAQRVMLANALAAVSAAAVRQAAERHLQGAKVTVCTLQAAAKN